MHEPADSPVKNMSINRKVLLMSMLACALSLLLTCVVFMINDYLSLRKNMLREAVSIAETLGNNSTAALAFADKKAAAEILSALRSHPHADAAALYGTDGLELARFIKNGHSVTIPGRLTLSAEKETSDAHTINVIRSVTLDSETVGSISLFYSLNILKKRFVEFTLLTIVVLFFSTLIAYVISSRLTRYISTPLLHLEEIASTISRDKDYSVRAERFSNDEIGNLTNCFNAMLDQIQERDTLLTKHREQLEVLVEERTEELKSANSTLVDEIRLREKSEQLRRAMEEELFNSRKLESIGVLSGGIAHNFNNILTAVVGFISLARNKIDNDTVRTYLEKAEQSCFRAKGLTEQLLTFSSGGNPVRRLTPIVPIIHEAVDISMSGSNVKCNVTITEPIRSAEIDSGQIIQVFNNLLLNACQAMPLGGTIEFTADNISILGELELTIPPGEYLRLTVTDHGEGIPDDIRHRIFDPYFTTKPTGTGLGLATCYSIIKNHGGVISASSQPGMGTTFTILLPVSEQAETSTPVATETGQSTRTQPSADRKLHILVMDDEPLIRDFAMDLFSHLGHEPACACDGAEAIALYKEAHEAHNNFDLVIMDLTIPGGMGGAEAVKKLLDYDRNACVVVSSGYSNEAVMSDFRSYGFRGVIHKPYTMEEIQAAITSLL